MKTESSRFDRLVARYYVAGDRDGVDLWSSARWTYVRLIWTLVTSDFVFAMLAMCAA